MHPLLVFFILAAISLSISSTMIYLHHRQSLGELKTKLSVLEQDFAHELSTIHTQELRTTVSGRQLLALLSTPVSNVPDLSINDNDPWSSPVYRRAKREEARQNEMILRSGVDLQIEANLKRLISLLETTETHRQPYTDSENILINDETLQNEFARERLLSILEAIRTPRQPPTSGNNFPMAE
ncbi:MAG: hypothetical protein AB1516_15095 [Pseudomonadota bacterium]